MTCAGVFAALHEHFHDAGEISAILVDSTMVRAPSCAAGAPKKKADKPPTAQQIEELKVSTAAYKKWAQVLEVFRADIPDGE